MEPLSMRNASRRSTLQSHWYRPPGSASISIARRRRTPWGDIEFKGFHREAIAPLHGKTSSAMRGRIRIFWRHSKEADLRFKSAKVVREPRISLLSRLGDDNEEVT